MCNIKLKYKGFIGDYQYSSFSDSYSGSIINANDLVTYDANSKKELIYEFKNSIDLYIDTCASIGFTKLLDPKLFNISKFFILLKIFRNIVTFKFFDNSIIKSPIKIFTHNNSTCEVGYNKKKNTFSGIIRRGAMKYRIDGRTLRELNEKFVARTSNLGTIRNGRRYITLPRKND